MLNTHVMVSIHHVANGHGNNRKRYIVETQDRALAVQLAFEHAETRLELRIVGEQLAWPVSTAYAQVAAAHGCIVLQVPVETPEEMRQAAREIVSAFKDSFGDAPEEDEMADAIDYWQTITGEKVTPADILRNMAEQRARAATRHA